MLRHIEPAKIEVSGATRHARGRRVLRPRRRGPRGRTRGRGRGAREAARSAGAARRTHHRRGCQHRPRRGHAEAPRPPQPDSLTHFLPRFSSLAAPDVVVQNVGADAARPATAMHAERVQGDLRMTRWRIDVGPSWWRTRPAASTARSSLRATLPLGLRGAANGRLAPARRAQLPLRGRGERQPRPARHRRRDPKPARLSFIGNALDLNRRSTRASARCARPSSTARRGCQPNRLPSLSGSISVDARHDGIGVSGTLTSPQIGAEQLRVQRLRPLFRFGDRHRVAPRVDAALGTRAHDGRHDPVRRRGTGTRSHAASGSKLRWPLAGEPSSRARSVDTRSRAGCPMRSR